VSETNLIRDLIPFTMTLMALILTSSTKEELIIHASPQSTSAVQATNGSADFPAIVDFAFADTAQ